MNPLQFMKQAQNIQKRLKETQEELAQMEVEGAAANGAVTVTYDASGKFKSIKLTGAAVNPENPDSVDADTLEMLEDLITTAAADASQKAAAIMEEKMKAATGGISIPGLF